MRKFLFSFHILIILTSCITLDHVPYENTDFTSQKTVYATEGISLSMTPLTNEELVRTHGSDSLIFTKHPGAFPPKKIVVIYCELRSDRNISLQYSDISLINATGKAYPSVSRRDLYELWENKLPAARKEGYARIIDHTLFPERIIVMKRKGIATGYMVFIMGQETSGIYHLSIPASATAGQSEHLILPIRL